MSENKNDSQLTNLQKLLKQITEPTVILDIEKSKQNLERMMQKCEKPNMMMRPHFKTHQSGKLGKEVFAAKGIHKISVSSVKMAHYFASYGFDNITIAFPTNILEIDSINELASRVTLNLLVDSIEVLHFLEKNIKKNSSVGIFIELDFGYKRSGVYLGENNEKGHQLLEEMVGFLAQSENDKNQFPLKFCGFLNHAGNSYGLFNKEQKLKLYRETVQQMNELKKKYQKLFNKSKLIISYGDTPTLSLVEHVSLSDFNEIRPGNFTLYDVQQHLLGSCELNNVAISVACPIMGLYPDRKELCLYGGGIHLGKDFQYEETGQKKYYGIPVLYTENGWKLIDDRSYVRSISQEHGVVVIEDQKVFDSFKLGDIIGILPVHSCMTVDKFEEMRDILGNTYGTIHQNK